MNASFHECWFSPSSHAHSAAVWSVAFSPDGKTLASGSGDKTIRLWDLSIYFDFLNAGKPTPLFFTFTEGVEYYLGIKCNDPVYEEVARQLILKYDSFLRMIKFSPLSVITPKERHKEWQSRFDQILEWAKKQQKGF